MSLSVNKLIQTVQRKPEIYLILLLTLITYYPSLRFGFIRWDDPIYITENALVNGSQAWHHIFTQTFEGHYHPLTLLSLRLDYIMGNGHPYIFHLNNVFLHLVNVLLVWLIALNFFKLRQVALLVALFFALHPLQVEAVAWVTARKDLLYASFFLLSLLSWKYYIDNEQRQFYFISLGFFLLSCLSKAQAIMLIAFLPILDHFFERKIKVSESLVEKIPFILIGISFGLIAIGSQHASGYTGNDTVHSSIFALIKNATWALMHYNIKLVYPLSLSAYYPYPILNTAMHTWLFWVTLSIFVAVVTGSLYLCKRRNAIGLGLMFFLICIAPMLKIIPVSNFLTADRYTYIASIGWFLAIVSLINKLKIKWKIIILIVPGVLWIYQTWQRIPVWKESETLINNILFQYPDVIPALNIRGVILEERGDFDAAMHDFNHALNIRPSDVRSLRNRGLLYARTGAYTEALSDFNKALDLDDTHADTYINKAKVHMMLQDYQMALLDLNKALELNPLQAEAWNSRGLLYREMGETHLAINDFGQAVQHQPDQAGYHFNRGMALADAGDCSAALQDVRMARQLGWQHPQCIVVEARCLVKEGRLSQAQELLETSLQEHPTHYPSWAALGEILFSQQQYIKAENALNHALTLDAGNATALYYRGLTRIHSGRSVEGCSDLQAALLLGHPEARIESAIYCKDN